jgi:hypothetical protein
MGFATKNKIRVLTIQGCHSHPKLDIERSAMEGAKTAIVTWLTRSMLLTHFRSPTRFTETIHWLIDSSTTVATQFSGTIITNLKRIQRTPIYIKKYLNAKTRIIMENSNISPCKKIYIIFPKKPTNPQQILLKETKILQDIIITLYYN